MILSLQKWYKFATGSVVPSLTAWLQEGNFATDCSVSPSAPRLSLIQFCHGWHGWTRISFSFYFQTNSCHSFMFSCTKRCRLVTCSAVSSGPPISFITRFKAYVNRFQIFVIFCRTFYARTCPANIFCRCKVGTTSLPAAKAYAMAAKRSVAGWAGF